MKIHTKNAGFQFKSQQELQTLIIPEMDEITIDAMFADFLVEHEGKETTEGQHLQAMSKMFLQEHNQSMLQHVQGEMDAGSKLSILYLLYKSKKVNDTTRALF